ncbi:hypothetical protein DFH08DRAFT_403543 [Mycena albidolilacea]|uniref:Uncharacterized protein n=1 Tax=Mycena albidolilacea TaxID=1033008 RepID=A0AAD7AHM3_9AGAR|nr:hypothetical protein DFH08DRAFT_403543 [Mycena albidolilacea]
MSHANLVVKRAVLRHCIQSTQFVPPPFPLVDAMDWPALINDKFRQTMILRGEEVFKISLFLLISPEFEHEPSASMMQVIRDLLLSTEILKEHCFANRQLLERGMSALGGLQAFVGCLWQSPGASAYAVMDWLHHLFSPLVAVATATYRKNGRSREQTNDRYAYSLCPSRLNCPLLLDHIFLTRLQMLQLADAVDPAQDDAPGESEVASTPAASDMPSPSGIERELVLLLDGNELPTSEAYNTLDQPPALLPALELAPPSTLGPGPVDILTAFSSNSAEHGGNLVLNLAVSLFQDALASGPDGQGALDPSQLRLATPTSNSPRKARTSHSSTKTTSRTPQIGPKTPSRRVEAQAPLTPVNV